MIEKIGVDFEERRSYKRARGRLPGVLCYGDDGQTVNCTVLDLSFTGAKVDIDDDGDPEGIDKSPGRRLKIGAAVDVPAEVIWRAGTFFGLRFLVDPREVAAALEELVRSHGM